jgi:hypothetical protein
MTYIKELSVIVKLHTNKDDDVRAVALLEGESIDDFKKRVCAMIERMLSERMLPE